MKRPKDPLTVVPSEATLPCEGIYGAPEQLNMLEAEMWAFLENRAYDEGALGRYLHFRRVAAYLFPQTDWNPWLEKLIRAACENPWLGLPGCAGSGKTHGISFFATVWWLMMPECSSVILTSTTKEMIRRRAWGNIQKFHREIPGPEVGNMVDSRTCWQALKGDDKHAISALAVKQGSTSEAVARIQGYHTRRQLVIVDEATDTPEAIFEACANLYNSPEQFQFICIGNPASRLDPFGRFCEPFHGWNSVDVDTEEWDTVVQLDGRKGKIIRFDAEKSPNVLAGETKFKYLVTEAQLEGARKRFGEDSPLFWKFQRGFWAPDGAVKTIFSEPLLMKMNGMGKFEWAGSGTIMVAGLDPAFGGGDRPILRFAKVGMTVDGKVGIELDKLVELSIKADSGDPVHFQLADQTSQWCRDQGVSPENLAVDATGEGGGLCDILQRQFGEIIRVEFGGVPSDRTLNEEDRRTCREVYFNRVAELWHRAREFMLSGQLRGVDASTAIEFCNRTFDDLKQKKVKLQTKLEMKSYFGRSPDLADAAVLAIEAAQHHGLDLNSVSMTDPKETWDSQLADADSLYDMGVPDDF